MTSTATPPDKLVAGYAPPGEDRPLAAYGGLMAAFGITLAGALAALRASGRELAARPRAGDLVLAGIATHKVSRLLAKDRVTSFVRAPFTRYQEPAGHGELEEQPRGTGVRLAIGELLVCPYCLAQWIAATFAVGLVAAPRATRFIAGIYVAETLSDVLQLAYKAAEDRA
ncbi:MAG: hypothetical protein AVDCRST_MAG67-1958 [uncultured Solirubrobacteraceae bacterium]|uniref:DUF1360 domain-containing protein n=1 Tax=uncultured Solirubrobacteraceae bacterium TaxID=1162706 RepID=A0A6J4SJ01_9ACTN|nr:MAG: hypothetical protein AVDCRST_MAG67-1958 [uncultured Solirubrobacteraceae bacterium]